MRGKKSLEERFLKSTYFSKGTDFSATDFTKPNYQLWVSKHFEGNTSEYVTYPSASGSAWHKACEEQNEIGVVNEFSFIKEFEGVTIGGTADLLEWDEEKNLWVIADHKTKGEYSAKKFKGFTRPITKTRKKEEVVEGERDKEILQLSIYRWLFEGPFNTDTKAYIYLWVDGLSRAGRIAGLLPQEEIEIDLIPIDKVKRQLKLKIEMAMSDTPPAFDCDTNFNCNYCDYYDVCPFIKSQNDSGFTDLTK